MDKILCGSAYFFNKFEDYKAPDIDEIVLVDEGNGYEYMRQISSNGHCTFNIVRRPKEELIGYVLNNPKVPSMVINRFLIPEFNREFGITIGDLYQLRPLVDSLDEYHVYLKTIYEAYIENGSFTLIDSQLERAYEVYKAAREEKED